VHVTVISRRLRWRPTIAAVAEASLVSSLARAVSRRARLVEASGWHRCPQLVVHCVAGLELQLTDVTVKATLVDTTCTDHLEVRQGL